ncbi:kinase-like domain-containing protein [Thelephora terrestris]|uniref:Kinase-like domain-containing protein n=1 Tax=Thelephora terrestris TaxID=56493 RepID=A0A9P6H9V9_9AGAM|nr:kinase-like domain-containing protein [Thelephora terrestris]
MPRSVTDILIATVREDYEATPEEIALVLTTLTPWETKWRDRHEMLKEEGYELRPRLRPGWKASWLESGADPLECEDGEVLPSRPMLVDAMHEVTGKPVYIKEVPTDGEELRIAQMLVQEEWARDPRNHCVPLMRVFKDHKDPNTSYMVMPLLRPVDNPRFVTVKEIIKFVDQILEGLVFLHEKRVAHRDCVLKNIMMDADAMYLQGFHPIELEYAPDYSGYVKYVPRSAAKVKYYFVDFGISVHIPESLGSMLVTGTFGRDRDPPELSPDWGKRNLQKRGNRSSSDPSAAEEGGEGYDPFKLDIFIIGNMLRREFQVPFSNLDFFGPLVEKMIQPFPDNRPSAEDALKQWQGIRKSISMIHRQWHPRSREEHPIGSFVLDTISLHRFFMSCAKSVAKRVAKVKGTEA